MARNKRFSAWLMLAATVSLLFPNNGFLSAQETASSSQFPQRQYTDVTLDNSKHIVGKVVSAEGQPAPNAAVQIFQNRRLITAAKTNANGEFRTGAIASGAYQLVTANRTMDLRAWANSSAPPTATRNLLVAETNVVRGQCCYSECEVANCDGTCGGGAYCGGGVGMLIHPMVIGAAVAAAIVIPLALDDDDDAS